MSIKLTLGVYRLFFATLVLGAVVAQLTYGIRNISGFSAINFFSFFTIESNVFGLCVFAVAARKALTDQKHDQTLEYLRGAATLYMVVTGIIYIVALSNADVQTPLPWVNAVLHYVFPAVILLDWLVDHPRKLSFKKSILWLLFPVSYLVYSLIRGTIIHWYAYPFLNVSKHGYATVALNSLGIAVAVIVLAFLLAGIPKFLPAVRKH